MCQSLDHMISQYFTHQSDKYLNPDMFNESASVLTSPRKQSRPYKLWQLPARYHCPLIGTCLSLDELRKLADKTRQQLDGFDEYDIHSLFISYAHSSNPVSRLMQKHLEKKYTLVQRRFAKAKTPSALLELWAEAWEQGAIADSFWAVMMHPQADEQIWHAVYAKMHMLSHQIGASQRADLQKLHFLQEREVLLQGQVKSLRQDVMERDGQLKALREELAAMRTQQIQTQASDVVLDADDLVEKLQRQVQQAQQESQYFAEQLQEALAQNQQQLAQLADLRQELAEAYAERDALEQHLEQLLEPDCSQCDKEHHCQSQQPDINGRCILYVGGRDKLKPHLRSMVEQCGGRFLHHDGGLHGKDHYLHQVLAQADTVFCPVDCISHNACQTIKRFCKKHNKHMVLLRKDSLSAFAQGLRAHNPDEAKNQLIEFLQ